MRYKNLFLLFIIGGLTACSSGTPQKRMYLAQVNTGNLGGVSGADAVCAAGKPTALAGTIVKAMISDGSSRVACKTAYCSGAAEHTDWVLPANGQIWNTDSTIMIGTTNDKGLLTNSASTALSANPTTVYTGLNADWTSVTSADNCNSWTDSTTSFYGIFGTANAAGSATDTSTHRFYSDDANFCNSTGALYCVEQ